MTDNSWSVLQNISQIIGIFFLPFVAWVLHTVVSHGKKLAMLELKVNDSINMRLDNLENKFDGLDEKMDHLKDSIVENKVQIQDNVNQKFGAILVELKKER